MTIFVFFFVNVTSQYAIIVAGGIGTRMKSDRPKQFLEINGETIIIKTIRAFLNYNPEISIIICIHSNYKSMLENLLDKFELKNFNIKITFGGDTRFDSVKNGLKLIDDENAIVAIHDAARPGVSKQTIMNCFETAASKGNAIPCVSVSESMRKINNNENNSVNRNNYKIIQTPQCFLVSKIKKAFEQNYLPAYTDDATVLESIGEKINLVEGNEENFKITSAIDLVMASAVIK